MDVDLEIHVPGLDLNQSRWSHHLLFMQDVHARLVQIVRQARDAYEEHGRGTLFVSMDQWREIVKHTVLGEEGSFPADYLPLGEIGDLFIGTSVRRAFEHVLEDYDPEQSFVLTVRHPPDSAVSCYLVRTKVDR